MDPARHRADWEKRYYLTGARARRLQSRLLPCAWNCWDENARVALAVWAWREIISGACPFQRRLSALRSKERNVFQKLQPSPSHERQALESTGIYRLFHESMPRGIADRPPLARFFSPPSLFSALTPILQDLSDIVRRCVIGRRFHFLPGRKVPRRAAGSETFLIACPFWRPFFRIA